MRKHLTGLFLGLILSTFVFTGGLCYGATLSCGNNLSVTFAENGSVIKVLTNGTDIINPAKFSGFDVEDMNSKLRAHITGKMKPTTSGYRFVGVNQKAGIRLIADIAGKGGCITSHTTVTDLTGRERAVRVYFNLNLKDIGWRWCANLTQSYPAEVGKRNFTPSSYAWHEQSTYPFGAVSTTDGTGIALAWPMSNPRFYTQTFTLEEDGNGVLQIFVPLGLSKYTAKFPRSASFDISIYAFDGRDDFRGALAKYYSLYPGSFKTRAKGYGLWTLWLSPGMENYAKRMGVLFHEAEFDLGWEDKAVRDDELGFQSFQYSEPWGLWHPFPVGFAQEHPGNHPAGSPREACLDQRALESYIRGDKGDMRPSDRFPGVSRDTVSRAMFNSAVYTDTKGDWMVYNYTPRVWIWENVSGSNGAVDSRRGWDSANIITNPDPGLPHPNRFDIEWDGQVMYAAKKIEKLGGKLDGVYVDSANFSMAWDRFNFRTDQWKYAEYPLAYTQMPDGKYVPAQALSLCFSQHLRTLRAKTAKYGWPLLVNGWDPLYAASAANIDILGAGEVGAAGVEAFAGEQVFALFRALAYRKPIIIMDYAISLSGIDANPEYAQTVVEPHINYLLMYGILPGTANSFNAASENKLKIVVPIFEKYREIFAAINSAGWEPANAASCGDSDILVEQWGKNTATGLYYTLRNTGAAEKQVVVNLDLSRVEGPAAAAKELVDGGEVRFTGDGSKASFTLTLPAGRTAAVQLK